MICPDCGAEYVDGIEQCVDCEVALVQASPAAEEGPAPEWTELLVVTDPHEAEIICGYLESEGVACNLESLVFNAEPFTFGPLSKVRLHVPRDAADRARELLAARDQIAFEEEPPSVV